MKYTVFVDCPFCGWSNSYDIPLLGIDQRAFRKCEECGKYCLTIESGGKEEESGKEDESRLFTQQDNYRVMDK